MKWRSHAAITRKICLAISLDDELTGIMVEGAVEPDRHPVRSERGGCSRRIPHHDSDDRTLMVLAWKSRKAFLVGEPELGCLDLGRLLHYVQDRSVRSGLGSRSHDRMEEEIARRQVPARAIQVGLEAALPSPFFVKCCIRGLRSRRDPEAAMYHSTATSAALVGAILGGLQMGDDVEMEWARQRHRHLCVQLPAATGVGLATAYSAYLADVPWLLPVSPAVFFLILHYDSRYRELGELRGWYQMG